MGDSLSLIDKKIKITKVTISITKIDTPINKQSLPVGGINLVHT